MEDIYLRLDREIERLLEFLDKETGKNNYVVFLTADHGGGDVAEHLIDNKIPSGLLGNNFIKETCRKYCQEVYNDSLLVLDVCNNQVFLNDKKLKALKIDKDEIEQNLCLTLNKINGVAEAYPSKVLRYSGFDKTDRRRLLQNGYNHKLSGNVCFINKPSWMDHGRKGTTHGSGYNYDTHIPVIFYGKGIRIGSHYDYVAITSIAPSICELLRINQPNASDTELLNKYFR
jgi:arylsulfatase A-like enzyme